MKIAHVITDLSTSGAEMMLYKIVSKMDKNEFDNQVISLTEIGAIGKKIRDLGITVNSLEMRRGFPDPGGLYKLLMWLRYAKPDLVQTWMYHANLIGGIALQTDRKIPLIWGIRHSYLDKKKDKKLTYGTAKICAKLSYYMPLKIVCCSHESKRFHIDFGYTPTKMVVIPNGFDIDLFHANEKARKSIREELSLPDQTILIGLIARFHPHKDHFNFCLAASILHRMRPEAHFVLCGRDVSPNNSSLMRFINEAGINSVSHLLGYREDIPAIQASLDIAATSSYSESFPNVIGEAMASSVPCVVTDVGDSALILGRTGFAVPPKDPEALANAWKMMIDMSAEKRKRLGLLARQRIENYFSLAIVTKQYEELYFDTLKQKKKY
jgi:glycosyltransferase involved in cell wall biosynthesis